MLKCGIERSVYSQRYPVSMVEAIVRGTRRQSRAETSGSVARCWEVQDEHEEVEEGANETRCPACASQLHPERPQEATRATRPLPK
eukprot:9482100-Pyramimonas_sp.AAC.1